MLNDADGGLQSLLSKYHLTPRSNRMWGQHFLVDSRVLTDIIDAAQIQYAETILEIGPGPGVLTRALLDAGAHVVAIEQDRRFAPLLQEEFGDRTFQLNLGNALTVHWERLGLRDQQFALVANLPYSITTPLFEKMLLPPRPARALLMIQRDVAQRISAGASHQDRGALSVILQHQYHIQVVRSVPRNAFYPPPAVESAIVQLTPTGVPLPDGFSEFVHNAFCHRRKYLRSNLQERYPSCDWKAVVPRLGIDERARPQDIRNDQWLQLFDFLK